MQDNILKKKTIKILRTINDLDENNTKDYRINYYKENEDVIRKYLSWIDLAKIEQNVLGRTLYPVDSMNDDKDIFWVATDLKYGVKDVYVPIDFYTLTETVLSCDCKVRGIFRVRNSMITVKECVNLLEEEIKNRTPFKEIRDKLVENFNVIDLTTAFKEIIRNYVSTVIPEHFIQMILKLKAIQDKKSRLILYHYLYISIPKHNRHVLEATIYFLYLLHDIATNNGTDYENNMSMEGISTVMMPNLLLKKNNDVSLEQVPLLVDFMVEFIANFPQIVRRNPSF